MSSIAGRRARNISSGIATASPSPPLSLFADGTTAQQICTQLPDLEPQDVAEALRFAGGAVRDRRVPLAAPA
ncbi:MAG: DUF433 domain-containing protein [Actinomycetota bacterium]|nr:DUF433 domain-containing protein [Actinomycetota bacterium]